jgi:hypothetical protein
MPTFGTTIGSGGFRFYDRDHEVSYNYVEGVYGGSFQGPLLIDTGDAEGSSTALANHWRVVNAMVERNVLVDNPEGIRIGDNYDMAPTGCTVRDNVVVQADTGQAVTQLVAPVSSTLTNNTYFSTPAAAGMMQDSTAVWRKEGFGPRLTFLQPADVGINGDPNDTDGTGTLIDDTGPPPPPPPDPVEGDGPPFVGAATPSSGTGATVSVNPVAGVQPGDFQLAVITCTAGETVTSSPAGWTFLDSRIVSSPTVPDRGGPAMAAAYYSTGLSAVPVTFTKSGSGFWHAARFAWRNARLGAHAATMTAAGSPITTPEVQPTQTKSRIVGVVATDLPNVPAGPFTPPAGWIERYDQTRTSGSDNLSIVVADISVDASMLGPAEGRVLDTVPDELVDEYISDP